MRLEDRRKAEQLEAILSRHSAQETRTLAELHMAGYKFQTITAAYKRLKFQRQLHGFTQEQIDIAIKVAEGHK